ncbi:MAG: LPS export ABC transporter permease LptF [Burkholderiales bacterium]
MNDIVRRPRLPAARASGRRLFQQALLREFATTGIATFLVLLAIALTTTLVRYLQQAARGRIDPEQVLALLGFAAFYLLPVLLSITLFIAVLMTLTRCYRDSEMVVWFSSGLGLTAWMRPVLAFAAPMVGTIALLSLLLSPWASEKKDEVRRQFEARSDVSQITPGVFRELRRGERVFFVEEVLGEQNLVSNVFVSSTKRGVNSVVVAQKGYRETMPNGDAFLVLVNGRQYEGVPGSPEYRISSFERYSVRVEEAEQRLGTTSVSGTTTLDLLRNRTPQHLGELAWRLGLPLSAFVLSLLAIPLSFVNPRAGRSLNLILAILIYMTYNNLLSITQAWIVQGRLSFVAGVLLVHVAMLALLALLFFRRLTMFSVFRLVPRP